MSETKIGLASEYVQGVGSLRFSYSTGGAYVPDEQNPGMSRNQITVEIYGPDPENRLLASATLPAELAVHAVLGNYTVKAQVEGRK